MKTLKLIVLSMAIAALAVAQSAPSFGVTNGTQAVGALHPCSDITNVGSVYTQQVSGGQTFICLQTGSISSLGAGAFNWTPVQTTNTSGGGTVQVASGKTAVISNSLTFAGTDATTATFPSSSIAVSGAVAQECGTSAGACSATNISATVKIVRGTAAATSASPSTVAITGISPAFTSAATFTCTAEDATTVANVFAVLTAGYVSGSAVTFTGPNTVTDTIRYYCIGY